MPPVFRNPGLCLQAQPSGGTASGPDFSQRSAVYVVAGREVKMREYTFKEKAKITVGAITALVIVGWFAVIALAIMVAQ